MTSAPFRAAAAGAPGKRRGRRPGRPRAARAVIPVLAALAATAGVATAGPAAAQVAGPASGTAEPAHSPRPLTAAWGFNSDDQLGFKTTVNFSATPGPVGIPAGMTVAKIAGGCHHAIAATTAGQVLAWGLNDDGQLGNGRQANSDDPSPSPVTLPPGARVRSVAAGCHYSLALTSAGQVLAWGDNTTGQVGQGALGGVFTTPQRVQLPAGARATAISAGLDFGLALTAGGHVYAWGRDRSGELGDGQSSVGTGTPKLVSLPRGTRVTKIAAGGSFALALTSTGRVLAWGDNNGGQLGNGNETAGQPPAQVPMPPGARVTGLTAGTQFSVALLSNGQLLAWGDNFVGQLGDGTTQDRFQPAPVKLPAGTRVKAVAAGVGHNLAITANGQLLAWGFNDVGEVGDDSGMDELAPVQVPLAPGHSTFALVIGTGPGSESSYAVYRKFG